MKTEDRFAGLKPWPKLPDPKQEYSRPAGPPITSKKTVRNFENELARSDSNQAEYAASHFRLSIMDGFRFGFGFVLAAILASLLIWAVAFVFGISLLAAF